MKNFSFFLLIVSLLGSSSLLLAATHGSPHAVKGKGLKQGSATGSTFDFVSEKNSTLKDFNSVKVVELPGPCKMEQLVQFLPLSKGIPEQSNRKCQVIHISGCKLIDEDGQEVGIDEMILPLSGANKKLATRLSTILSEKKRGGTPSDGDINIHIKIFDTKDPEQAATPSLSHPSPIGVKGSRVNYKLREEKSGNFDFGQIN